MGFWGQSPPVLAFSLRVWGLVSKELALTPGLLFSLNITKETNGRMDGRTHEKNRPGSHCRGCSAHALKITQNLGNRIFCHVLFHKLYNFNLLQWCFYVFSHQPGYLFLDYNLGEVDSNQQQVLNSFSVVLAPSLRLCVRCVRAVIVICSLLCNYRVHLCV